MRVDDVVIVGAGPAGLAAAATLRARGIDTTIIERGRVGEPWRSRYDRLHLHTIRSLSHLPGYRFPASSAGGWHVISSCNTWSSMRRTIGSSRGSGLRPRVLTAITATGASARLLARFPRGWSWWPLDIPAFHICPDGLAHSMGRWFIRWNTAIRSRIATRTCSLLVPATAAPRLPSILPRRCPTGTDRDPHAAEYPAARREGLPHPAPWDRVPAAADPAAGPTYSRAATSDYPGLECLRTAAAQRAVSQFRRTGTVPIFDVGFIDAVRSGVIEVVPGVTALDGRAVVLADGSRVSPDAVVAATGYQPGLAPLVGHLTAIGEHGIPARFHRNAHPNLRATARSWRGCPTHCRRRGARTWRLEATSHCHRELGRWGCWELEHNPGSGDCDREEP